MSDSSIGRRHAGAALVWGVLALVIALLVLLAYFLPGRGGEDAVVVYCAHDQVFAEPVLRRFEKETGIRLSIRYDTEANKSLGLTELIQREADAPRCDVFWNNQLLGTADLKQRGLLAPYKGAGFTRIPDGYKDPDGDYCGFAARLRVIIINRDRVPDSASIDLELARTDQSRIAMANPIFGTTLSHGAVLWDIMGPQGFQDWYRDLRGRGLVVRGGNATVKDLVAQGTCDLGYTDTDDYYVAQDAGEPVRMVPVWVDAEGRGLGAGGRGQAAEAAEPPSRLRLSAQDTGHGTRDTGQQRRTICIPNTVAIIKNCRNPEEAKKLVDYLLSEEVELALAASKSRQIPLGPVDESKLSAEVRELRGWAAQGYPLTDLSEARTQCLAWLKSEFFH